MSKPFFKKSDAINSSNAGQGWPVPKNLISIDEALKKCGIL